MLSNFIYYFRSLLFFCVECYYIILYFICTVAQEFLSFTLNHKMVVLTINYYLSFLIVRMQNICKKNDVFVNKFY